MRVVNVHKLNTDEFMEDLLEFNSEIYLDTYEGLMMSEIDRLNKNGLRSSDRRYLYVNCLVYKGEEPGEEGLVGAVTSFVLPPVTTDPVSWLSTNYTVNPVFIETVTSRGIKGDMIEITYLDAIELASKFRDYH